MYTTTPESIKFAGITTIFFKRSPVWRMSYEGWYLTNQDVIWFLKYSLLSMYESDQFWGGRGKPFAANDTFMYKNEPLKNEFTNFFGQEEMFDLKKSEQVGWARYSGLWLGK